MMVKKIKNTAGKEIDFGTFKLKKSSSESIQWDKNILTPEAFGLILKAYSDGDIAFMDDKDKEVKDIVKSKYHTLTKTGKKSAKETSVDIDNTIIYLNQEYNKLINS